VKDLWFRCGAWMRHFDGSMFAVSIFWWNRTFFSNKNKIVQNCNLFSFTVSTFLIGLVVLFG